MKITIFLLLLSSISYSQYTIDIEQGQQGVYFSFEPQQENMAGYETITTKVESDKGKIVATRFERIDKQSEDYEVMFNLPAGTYKVTMFDQNNKVIAVSKLFTLNRKI